MSSVLQIFTQRDYDCLDPDCPEFQQDLDDVSTCFADLDKRLGNTFCRGLEDCSTAEHIQKVLLKKYK